MKQLTAQAILDVGGPKANKAIAVGTVNSLAWLDAYGISQPARLAHFLAQCGEESDHFHTLEEYASGATYEGRKDLGNTQPGDGKRFKGRGLIEVTGRANCVAFQLWIDKQMTGAPNFVTRPELLATFPWALYSAVWYWTSHNLNKLADEDNIEAITHKVNGGLNGLGERMAMLGRASLILLDYPPTAMKAFQTSAGLDPDGILGAKTRGALHAALVALPAPDKATLAVHAPPAAPVTPEAPAAIRPPKDEAIAAPAPVPMLPAAAVTPLPVASFLFWRFFLSLFGL